MKSYPYLIYERNFNNHLAVVIDQNNIKSLKKDYYLNDNMCKYNNKEFILNKHWHFHYQILYIKKKGLDLFIDGQYKFYPEGSIIFIEPFKVHGIYISDIENTMLLKIVESFKFDFTYYDLLEKHNIKIPSKQKMSTEQTIFNKKLIEYCERLIELDKNYDELSIIERKNLIDRIFFVLLKYFSNPEIETVTDLKSHNLNNLNQIENYWVMIVKYINNHFKEKITIKDLANHVNLSPMYLSSNFKEKTGITISTYIEKVRMTHALNDLNNKHLSVEQVAINNGFNDSKALNRALKKEFGKTAKHFRNS